MFLVDTNIWSEATRLVPDENVRRWANQHADQLWLSTIVIGELLSGVALLPTGKRKDGFSAQYEAIIAENMDRIVEYDLEAARHYAEVIAFLEKAGRNPTTADVQIAATALSGGFQLATRNVKDFEGIGIVLINPWDF